MRLQVCSPHNCANTSLNWYSTISLGKYGSFPSNLIIHRPFHLTYELQDKKPGENFSRLRVVPPEELYADIFAEEAAAAGTSGKDKDAVDDSDKIISAMDEFEYSLVDNDTGSVLVRSNREILDDSARQTLTMKEIEVLKRDGTDAGKDLIAKLMLSHTALDQKTSFSLAKYKLLKTKKYIRRFTVLPLDPTLLGQWQLNEKDGSRILDMREEMLGLLGCWGNVHCGGEAIFLPETMPTGPTADEDAIREVLKKREPEGVRYLVVDDTGGFLVAAMAERMGILYSTEQDQGAVDNEAPVNGPASIPKAETASTETAHDDVVMENGDEAAPQASGLEAKVDTEGDAPAGAEAQQTCQQATQQVTLPHKPYRRPRHPTYHDFHIPFSLTNTMTMIHSNSQPNLSFLKYYGFDDTDLINSTHPLVNHLLTMSWLQLLDPEQDSTYTAEPVSKSAEEVSKWKANRRGQYHRKRRRWARTRYIIDSARAGGFSGLVVASTMTPISVLRPLLPLLAGGASVAVYSQALEPLTELADCFSVSRRAAWSGHNRPVETDGKTVEELENWPGSDEFPINPTLLQGVQIQTSRARKWQVLPGRTHPLMTAKGGAEGYVFTAWRVKPVEGKVEARGKFKKRKIGGGPEGQDSAAETPAA
ncbi:putative gcd10p family protein [Phaeoacremonium minimum UCRPA7]|uniref:tRNA (adenine(58)-N(1))-methyltransferase non-catalytic subunit TRM6 n=1 Tax=Phaeoacremonium minimum (strain UCR-PA7) TaxID=1286976 RepID=R8BQH2_PHAM7|nr:putative gcd10p family protein [Phaeoacremonium minimum UCRPA7]EOO01579.1 putative gcd10p family protein [Phaeoacremonium minimum UCRPA7]